MSQTINFPGAGNYALSWRGASRVGQVNPAVIELDGVVINQWQTANTAWTSFAANLNITAAGNHTITFRGLNLAGGDNSVGIDAVAITNGTGALPTVSGLIIENNSTLDLNGATQLVGQVGRIGPFGNVVGNIIGGTLHIQGNNMYLQSGTVSANLTSFGDVGARLWIGGDAGATVLLGGVNTINYFFADRASTIIGYGPATGPAGIVKLTTPTALGPASENMQIFDGTLDLNGQVAITVGGINMMSGSTHALINSNTGAAASYAGPVTLQATTQDVGGAGNLNLTGAISGNELHKIGAGTLTLEGAQTYATLTASEGTTNVKSPVGTGASIVNADAVVNFGTSQTLDALNIGPAGVVTVGPIAMSEVALAPGNVQAVPEPGTLSLLVIGVLGLVRRRR